MLKEINEGIEFPAIRRRVTQENINDFAEISGGTDPIHINPEFAAQTDFKATLAHGLMLVGYISDILYEAFGKPWLNTGTMNIKFVAPTKVNEEITTQGRIEKIETLGQQRKVYCHTSCSNEKGPVIIAEVTVTVSNG